ncbi:MAG: helix-turn-helix domain-containing protein [Nitrospirota bacterium]
MKAELETGDIEAIAQRVVELLKPLMSSSNGKRGAEDIFDVKKLSEYLKVTSKWIYEQTHLKTIPHYKITNKQLRFKKKDIDKWLETLKVPATSEPTGKLRLIKR